MTQYILTKNDHATEMFWDACRGGGSSWITCDCGIDWNSPEDQIKDDYGSYYRFVELEGKTFVQECEECCKKLARYERWIWNHRDEIREYLRIRVEQQLKWAEQEKLLNTIAGIK